MVEVACEERAVRIAIEQLCEQVETHGGSIDHRLVVAVNDSAIAVRAPAAIAEQAPVLRLPRKILLPVAGFRLAFDAERLVLHEHHPSLDRGQVAVMRAMLTVFNVLEKPARHRLVSTVLNWRQDDELFQWLARSRGAPALPFLDRLHRSRDEQFVIQSFLDTRLFHFQGPVRGAQQRAAPGHAGIPVLMPIIDFLNNHPQASRYLTRFGGTGHSRSGSGPADGIMTLKSCPVPSSDECFVCYGRYDALDTFFNYNYVEPHAGFVRSIPMEIHLPGLGTLGLDSVEGELAPKRLPRELEDLAAYLPPMKVNRERSRVMLAFVLIPQHQAPYSMRRVLALALSQLCTEDDKKQMRSWVELAEQQIVTQNEDYYQRLATLLETPRYADDKDPVLRNARVTARVQLENIRRYPFFADTRRSSP